MIEPASAEITKLLQAWHEGDPKAFERLTPLVYDTLKRVARVYARRERAQPSIDGTGLLHDAYLRLIGGTRVEWRDRTHFYAVAAQIMRRILIDAARTRGSLKRGGGAHIEHGSDVGWQEIAAPGSAQATALCDLDDALTALAQLDPRRARVVELRFFGGLSLEETARTLEVSVPTVTRDWNVARAWLARELDRGVRHGHPGR
jgi:RNA polymerase sigma factor (TIGR02999 family)